MGGRPKGRCMVCQVQKYLLLAKTSQCCSQRIVIVNSTLSSEITKNLSTEIHRNCFPCKLKHAQLCGVLTYMPTHEHIFFIYSSPSDTYLTIILLKACTYPLALYYLTLAVAIFMYSVSAATFFVSR